MSINYQQGRLDVFGGLRRKWIIFYLDAKLLLINVNYVEFFLFFRNFIDIKNLTKFFILIDVADCSGK